MLQDDIRRKGVVFDKMKEEYLSPDKVHQHTVQRSLCPAHSKDSGEDHKVIPQITFKEFQVPLSRSVLACPIFAPPAYSQLQFLFTSQLLGTPRGNPLLAQLHACCSAELHHMLKRRVMLHTGLYVEACMHSDFRHRCKCSLR